MRGSRRAGARTAVATRVLKRGSVPGWGFYECPSKGSIRPAGLAGFNRELFAACEGSEGAPEEVLGGAAAGGNAKTGDLRLALGGAGGNNKIVNEVELLRSTCSLRAYGPR